MPKQQLSYNEYKSGAGNTLRIYVDRMEKIIKGVGTPFDGIPISVFAHQARENGNFTYPDDKKVQSLVGDMNSSWQSLLSRRHELDRFKVRFFSQAGAGGFPVLMLQVWE